MEEEQKQSIRDEIILYSRNGRRNFKRRTFVKHCCVLLGSFGAAYFLLFPHFFKDFEHSKFHAPPRMDLKAKRSADRALRSEVEAYFDKLDTNQSAHFYAQVNSNSHLDLVVVVFTRQVHIEGYKPEMRPRRSTSEDEQPEVVLLRNLAAFDQQVKRHFIDSHVLFRSGKSSTIGLKNGLVGLAICGEAAADLTVALKKRVKASIPFWQGPKW